MMEPIKLGYVGCGFMAQKVHIPNFTSLPNCELIGLAEVRPELGHKVQQRWEIPRLYTDHTELAADPEIEAVAVSADFALQGEIAKDLLSTGKQVFMEKPMAVSVEQAESIVAAGKAAGKKADGWLHETVRRRQRAGQVQGGCSFGRQVNWDD